MPLNLPTVIGHRGAAACAPENTIESIHTAADMGCKWVEFDVKLTKDSVPILFHDDLLDRTTNGHGNVTEIKFSDLRDLECGSWFSDGFGGIKIPTLEEAVEVILERDLGMNVELKPCPGREVETTEATLDLLSQIWDDRDRLLISSFSHVSLETAMDMAGDWYRGLLLESEPAENWAELADYLDATTINIDGRTATREFIEEIMDTDDPDAVNDLLFKAH